LSRGRSLSFLCFDDLLFDLSRSFLDDLDFFESLSLFDFRDFFDFPEPLLFSLSLLCFFVFGLDDSSSISS